MPFYPTGHTRRIDFSDPHRSIMRGRNGYTCAATAELWPSLDSRVYLDLWSTRPGRQPTISLCLPAEDMLALGQAIIELATLTLQTPPVPIPSPEEPTHAQEDPA